MKEYETLRSEAARLGVSYSTVRRWVDQWKPTARPSDLICDGRTVRIRHDGLCEWVFEKRKNRGAEHEEI